MADGVIVGLYDKFLDFYKVLESLLKLDGSGGDEFSCGKQFGKCKS